MKKIIALISAFVLAASVTVTALAMELPDMPATEAEYYAADYKNVLSEDTRAAIVAANQSLRTETGSEIVVVTVDNTEDKKIEDFAREIGDTWRVGSKDYCNGVVLLLSIKKGKYYCDIGDGLRGFVGDFKTITANDFEPDFNAKNYDAAVTKCINSLSALIRNTGIGGEVAYCKNNNDYTFAGFRNNAAGGLTATKDNKGLTVSVIIFLVLAAGITVWIAFSVKRRDYYSAGKMKKMPLWPFLFGKWLRPKKQKSKYLKK